MPTNQKILAIIPARWASVRFPGKPIADILGKPMVQWVSEQAQKASLVSEVVIATDDKRIYDVVLGFGGKVVMTSPKHQSGTDRVAEVARNIECDIVVNIQGDEPLIPPENIDLVIKPLLDSGKLAVSTLMTAITSSSENTWPRENSNVRLIAEKYLSILFILISCFKVEQFSEFFMNLFSKIVVPRIRTAPAKDQINLQPNS